MNTQIEAIALALSVAKEILRESPELYISLKGICIEFARKKCEELQIDLPESITELVQE